MSQIVEHRGQRFYPTSLHGEPFGRWPSELPLPPDAPQPMISAALATSGDLPLGTRAYASYARLGRLINEAYNTLLTPEWLHSRHFIDHDYRIYMEHVDGFWEHYKQDYPNDETDLWLNLPEIAAALRELLAVYRPGWKRRDKAAYEETLKRRLLDQTTALLSFMAQK